MSWLPNNSFLTNITRQQNRPVFRTDSRCDLSACFDSFREHWLQASKIIQKSQQLPGSDDVLGVVSHLEQMVTLLLYDVSKQDQLAMPANNTSMPCLEYLLSENILTKLYEWGTRTGRFANAVRLEQLKLYEMLISQSRHQLLVHEPFLRPLLELLMSCQGEVFPINVEKRLVVLLNQLCVLLMQNIDLLNLFFCSSSQDHGSAKFIIFTLLTPFIHREGAIGMQARDALLLCMSLSKKNKNIGVYIAEHSNICDLLASGLSGLYSVLPHTLDDIESEDWHRFTPDDVNDIKDLEAFINSLEFSNAVAQVAHPRIKQQLHEFLYRGFLIPVMGPALLQNSVDEQIAAIAYLDLLLRSVTEPGLLLSLVKFLLEEIYDGKKILDILIYRIKGNTRLSLVSLALFESLLNFYCEDIMLELVFQYLQPCMHIMKTQRKLLYDIDPYCQNVEKFLLLTPVCCTSTSSNSLDGRIHRTSISSLDHTKLPGTVNWSHYGNQLTESLYGNYHAYLCDARNKITSCKIACSRWSNRYDGCDKHKINILTDSFKTSSDIDEFENFLAGSEISKKEEQNNGSDHFNAVTDVINLDESTTLNSLQSVGESSGYESLKQRVDDLPISERLNSLPVWQISQGTNLNNECDMDHLESTLQENPSVGIFLNVLFDKLENMLNNHVYVNLHLTGLFSRLATYPHPLLKTYLLNHKLVLQPNVRSLFQVIGSLKQKIDEYMCKQSDAAQEITQARWFLIEREIKLFNARKRVSECNSHSSTTSSITSDPFKRDEPKRRSLTSSLFSMFKRNSSTESSNILLLSREEESFDTFSGSCQSVWYKEKSEVKNYALCAVILEEWLKELAAISQEHTIAQLTTIAK